MKRKMILGFSTACVILAVSACGGNGAKAPKVPAQTEVPGATAAGPAGEAGESVLSEEESMLEEKNMLQQKLEESDYKAYAKTILTMVADKNIEALADEVITPFYVVTPALPEGLVLHDGADLIPMGNDVFSDDLMTEIASIDTEALTAAEAGVVLGYNETRAGIIIGIREDGSLGITSISAVAD